MKIRLTYKRKLLLFLGCILGFFLSEIISCFFLNFEHLKFFKKTKFKLEEDTQNFRIAILGGSTTFGWPFHKYLNMLDYVKFGFADNLNIQNIIIDNYSKCGYSLEKSANYFFDNAKYKPQAIVIYSGQNEFFAYYSENLQRPNWLKMRFLFFNTWRLYLHKEYRSQTNEYDDEYNGPLFCEQPIPEFERKINLQCYIKYFEFFIDYCKKNNIYLLIIIPEANYLYSPNRNILKTDIQEKTKIKLLSEFLEAYYEKNINQNLEKSQKILENLYNNQNIEFVDLLFELGEIYYLKNDFDKAKKYLQLSKNLDDKPMRILDSYRNSLENLCIKNNIDYIQMTEIINQISPTKLPDYNIFYDAHHLKLEVYIYLAQEILKKMVIRNKYWQKKTMNNIHWYKIDKSKLLKHFNIPDYYDTEAMWFTTKWFESTWHVKKLKFHNYKMIFDYLNKIEQNKEYITKIDYTDFKKYKKYIQESYNKEISKIKSEIEKYKDLAKQINN